MSKNNTFCLLAFCSSYVKFDVFRVTDLHTAKLNWHGYWSRKTIIYTFLSVYVPTASHTKTVGAFHLGKISGISGSAVNGTRFVGSSHWKIPRKGGKSKKVVPFSRLEFLNGKSCSIYVSRILYQFQVHGRAPPRTGVYDQMEQLFTNWKFHFCYHRNYRGFFLNGKRPKIHTRFQTRICIFFFLS